MEELREKKEEMKHQEDMQEQEMQKLRQLLSEYEVESITSNQRTFNRWMMSEILKLKEAVNQIGEGLDFILSEKSPEQEDTIEKELAEKKKKLEEVEEEITEIKKKRGRPPLAK